MRWRALGFF
jgi:hypothetical protein